MGHPVVHFEVIGSDGDKLRAYYSELFHWKILTMEGPTDYGVVLREENLNADGIGIGGGVGGAQSGGHVTFYVEVPDIDAAMDKAESLGGTRLSEPDEVPGQGIKIAHIADPEGHTLGLLSSTG